MQVLIITGLVATGKTTRLRAIQSDLKEQGIDAPIITGSACTTPYFLAQITQQAESGTRHFLADDCTRQQIQAVQELESREDCALPEDLTIHLVRQA